MKEIYIELVRSLIKCTERQIQTIKSLGLKKLHSQATLPDNDSVRGKIKSVSHLVKAVS